MKVFSMIFVSHDQATEVVQPSKEPFDLPALTVAAKSSTIVVGGTSTPVAMWSQQDHVLGCHLFTQRIAVVSLVGNHEDGLLIDVKVGHCGRDQTHLGGGSSFCVQGDRKTMSVCNCHDLGPLATLCLSNSRAPFLAAEKLPSMKVSFRSSLPRLRKSSASPARIRDITPSFTHRWNLRWTVADAPYRRGRSCQGAPVRKIQRIPLRAGRGSLHGRPLPSVRLGSSGRYSLTMFHCSSVRSIRVSLYTYTRCTSTIYEMPSRTTKSSMQQQRAV